MSIKRLVGYIGKGLLWVLKVIFDYLIFWGAIYAIFRGEIVGAFLLCFMAIGLEIKTVGENIKSNTDSKIKEKAIEILKGVVKDTEAK